MSGEYDRIEEIEVLNQVEKNHGINKIKRERDRKINMINFLNISTKLIINARTEGIGHE